MWYLIIAGIAFTHAVLIWDIVTDKKKYDQQDYYFNHRKDFKLRVGLLVPAMICFFLNSYRPAAPALVGFYYWFMFDGLYNIIVLKKNFFTYIGGVASTDKWLVKIGWQAALVLKLVLIAGSTYLYLSYHF